jgi:hypothetical protein
MQNRLKFRLINRLLLGPSEIVDQTLDIVWSFALGALFANEIFSILLNLLELAPFEGLVISHDAL